MRAQLGFAILEKVGWLRSAALNDIGVGREVLVGAAKNDNLIERAGSAILLGIRAEFSQDVFEVVSADLGGHEEKATF